MTEPGTKLSRRRLLAWLGAAPWATTLAGASAGCATDRITVGFGPWPARPGRDRTSLWCEAPHDQLAGADLFDAAGAWVATEQFAPLAPALSLATFQGLREDTAYTFRARAIDGSTYDGSFRTLPGPTGLVRVAFGADVHPSSAPYLVFDRIREHAPHVFVGLGDQVYADLPPEGPIAPDVDAYYALYRRTWNDESLRRCWANVASLLVWDDHEVWNDFDATIAPERLAAGRTAYEHFQRSRAESPTPWSILELGPASVFVLDTRTYRSANGAPDGAAKTMLGPDQLDALLAWLAASTAPLRILASPTPFHRYADTGEDNWAYGFAYERDRIFQAIADLDPSSVLLVSGDLHFPIVVANPLPGGATVLELTCTPLAAFSRPPPSSVGTDVLYVGADQRGFGLFEIDGSTTPPSISFAWIDEAGAERFAWSRA